MLRLFKPTTLAARLEGAQRLREQALRAETLQEREELLREARRADTAARIHEWLSSTGLQPPS